MRSDHKIRRSRKPYGEDVGKEVCTGKESKFKTREGNELGVSQEPDGPGNPE